MAFESHGFHNYETIVPLSLEYSRTPVSYPAGKWASDPWYRYTRRATKTYIYRGMSEAALKKCLAEKRSQYMRRFISWKWQGFDMEPCDMGEDYFEQVAQFNVSKREVVYDLQIVVDETVHLYSRRNYSPNNEKECQWIEKLFSQPVSMRDSWVRLYSYDEPGGK